MVSGASAEGGPSSWRALEPAPPSPGDLRSFGVGTRKVAPRRTHAVWQPAPDRPDPVEVLIESNRTRAKDLVPIRYGRMMASPFAFFRGSALMMALDLATTPSCGITVQLCGDAHLVNFGLFASPERQLLFDLNDFDETWPGPFEWDVKRLAASGVLAARASGMNLTQARAAAVAGVRSYRKWIREYAAMTHLEVWYSRLDADALSRLLSRPGRSVVERAIDKAVGRTHHRAVAKLTRPAGGSRRIIPDPPLITRADDDPSIAGQFPAMIEEYRRSLAPDRLALFDHYRLVDFARKVVGVGSVGTLCWILLMQGPMGGPLFLQAKQAGPAAPQLAGCPGVEMHHGQRVVQGQLCLQAASDVLLGWTTAPETGNHYYIRQLWDSKGAAEVELMDPAVLARYMSVCGGALARAHARTGGSASIDGYLGGSDRFDEAVADFAEAYADQAERDHAALTRAASDGLIPVEFA